MKVAITGFILIYTPENHVGYVIYPKTAPQYLCPLHAFATTMKGTHRQKRPVRGNESGNNNGDRGTVDTLTKL